jgi:transposase
VAEERRRYGGRLTIVFMDEGRFGRISDVRACWAPPKIRPKVARQVVRQSTYAFAAVAPLEGAMVSMISPRCNTEAMSRFLLEMLAAWPDRRLLVFLDGAGWHKSRALPVAERMRLEYLPPYTPECNPSEHIWDEVREKGFANELFASLDGVEVRLRTELENLACHRKELASLTCFEWLKEGLLYL